MPRFRNRATGLRVEVSDAQAARLGHDWEPVKRLPGLELPPIRPPRDPGLLLPNDTWTLAQLRDYAEENGISLDGVSKKADVLAAIQNADTP